MPQPGPCPSSGPSLGAGHLHVCSNACPGPAALAAAGTASETASSPACTSAWAGQREALEHRALSHVPRWRLWQPAQPSCTQQEDTDPGSALTLSQMHSSAGMGVTFFSGRAEGADLLSKAHTVAEEAQLLWGPGNASPRGRTHPAPCPLLSQVPTLLPLFELGQGGCTHRSGSCSRLSTHPQEATPTRPRAEQPLPMT